MKPTVERRKHPRCFTHFYSIASTDRVPFGKGLVVNLSLGGCRLLTAIHLPSGIPIIIHIQPDHQSPVYVPNAVVCWNGDSVFGLKFNELSKLESSTLTRLLCTLRS